MKDMSGVTMGDYNGFYPEELSGLQQSADLMKALDSGSYGTTTSGGPLIGQSLENTVHAVTYDIQKHIPLFRKIVKQPAFATVEEFNRLLAYGTGGGFFADGGLPDSDDAQYERATEKIKFMGAMGEVTGPMMLAGRAKFGDILAQQVYNRTAFLLGQIEKALYFANDTFDTLAFRGIIQQILASSGSDHVIDMKGQPIELSTLEDAATIIADNYGFVSGGYFSVQAKADLAKLMYPVSRYNSPGQAAAAGVPINKYSSANGEIELVGDVFLRPGSAPLTTADTNAPAAPGAPTCTEATVAGAAITAGTYYYKASSVNSSGESLATAGDAAIVISASTGKAGQLVITNVTAAKSYKIYRGTTATNMTFLEEVAKSTGGTTTYQDIGTYYPGTSKAIVLDESILALKQLLPMRKVDLARVADSTRWMQICYLAAVLYAPKKAVLIKNIGRAV